MEPVQDRILLKYRKDRLSDAYLEETPPNYNYWMLLPEHVGRTMSDYKLWEKLLLTNKPYKTLCRSAEVAIGKLVYRFDDVFSLQKAKDLLEACPWDFIDKTKIIFPENETLVDVENYIFKSKHMYIKATKDMYNVTIFREAFVGIMCLNSLRLHTPNFAFILGAWRGQRPIVYKKYDDVYTHVSQHSDSLISEKSRNQLIGDYVAYEEINGITLKKYMRLYGGFNIKHIIWQLGHALKLAYNNCKFNHQDLHHENIIIRPEIYTFNYVSGGKVKTLTSNIIVTIIDYGRSTVTYNGVEYAKWFDFKDDDEFHGDTIYPIRDLKFMVSSLIYKYGTDDNPSLIHNKAYLHRLYERLEKSTTLSDFEAILSDLNEDIDEIVVDYPTGSVMHELNDQKERNYYDDFIQMYNSLPSYNTVEDEDHMISYGANIIEMLQDIKHVESQYLKDKMTRLLNGERVRINSYVTRLHENILGYSEYAQINYDIYVILRGDGY